MSGQGGMAVASWFARDNGCQGVEQAGQHRGAARCVLPDHVEHRICQAIVVHAGDHQVRFARMRPDSRGQEPTRQVTQRRTQSVQHTDGRVGIVNAG